ncbi:MAG: sensor histidine kinase, partial [Candidatus Promineifilaceae bacterium]
AALLAAFGIRRVSQRQIQPLELSHIDTMLRLASLAFVCYAVFAGLIVPYADFFPARWLNQSLFVDSIGIPVELFRSLIGLLLVITMIRAMEVFDVEVDRMIEEMQGAQTLAAERERLGRELHDGAIQMVYSAGLIVESARAKVDDDSVVGERLDNALGAIDQAISSLRATMIDLRSQPESGSLVEGLQQQAADPRLNTLLDVTFENKLPEVHFDRVQTRHILAISAEALSNVVRHAEATQAIMSASSENGRFVLLIRDNGVGYDPSSNGSSYGVRNMRDRARLLGGELTFENLPGGGTTVKLSVPWENA